MTATGAVSALSVPVDGLPFVGRTLTLSTPPRRSSGCGPSASPGGPGFLGVILPFLALAAALTATRRREVRAR